MFNFFDDIDFEKAKVEIVNFFYKNRLKIVFLGSIIGLLVFLLLCYNRSEYLKMIESSDQLLDYIDSRDSKFINSNHKKGYKIIKDIIVMKKNPTDEYFKYFSIMDGFVFQRLFYFTKQLYAWQPDEFFSYYECAKNPWGTLLLSCAVMNGGYDVKCMKNKPEYLLLYLIGLGKKC